MITYHITPYTSVHQQIAFNEFEEALLYAALRYSMQRLIAMGVVSEQHATEALQKSLQVCLLAGINTKQHFKEIYVFDATLGIVYTDWLMSKKGFNLWLMQCPVLNQQIANWLWQLS